MSKNHQVKLVFLIFSLKTITFHLLNFHHSALVFCIFCIGDVLDGDALEDAFVHFSTCALNDGEIIGETISEKSRIEECRQIAEMLANYHISLLVYVVSFSIQIETQMSCLIRIDNLLFGKVPQIGTIAQVVGCITFICSAF